MRGAIIKKILSLKGALSYRTVIGTSNFESILQTPWESPAAFVYRASQSSGRENYFPVQSIQTNVVYHIVTSVTNNEDRAGNQDDVCEQLTERLITLLDCYQIGGASRLYYVTGQAISSLERNTLLWRSQFTIQRYIHTSLTEECA